MSKTEMPKFTKQKKRIVILGTGGNSVDILDAINAINSIKSQNIYECIAFIDDNKKCWGRSIGGVKILGPLSVGKELNDCYFINSIGNSSNFFKKNDIIVRTGIPNERFINVIHPTASLSETAVIANGIVMLQNATISSNAKIGSHVIVLPSAVISHDDIIGDYTCVTSGVCISGNVKIGKSCYIGSNSSIIENISIGENCLVGMGSVVIKDIPDNCVVAGNPARFLRNTIKT
jgi:sugar O-acyltransferase (sialic acid O-acetyltransferase NeuD family)